MKTALLLLLILTTAGARAWETDNVTCRTRKIGDATDALNAETRRRIQAALASANNIGSIHFQRYKKMAENFNPSKTFIGNMHENDAFNPDAPPAKAGSLREMFKGIDPSDEMKACSPELLRNALRGQLAGAWTDNLETWATNASLPKCDIPVSESVYSVFSITESPVAKSAGINPVISIRGHRVGVDKLSHFMTEGFNEWSAAKNGGIEAALELGKSQEEGGYGLKATGVKSYADMAANYKGYAFWTAVLDGDDPYFECKEGRWAQRRPFDWADYADASLDESVNCNDYSTPEMEKKLDDETAKRWSTAGLAETLEGTK